MKNSIIQEMVNRNIISEQQKRVYEYGLKIFIQSTGSFVCMLFIAILTKTINICLGFCLAYFPLRHYAGGYHQNSKIKCFLTSEIIYVCIALSSKIEFIQKCMGINILCIIIISLIIVWREAPIDHENRRITSNQKKIYGKRSRMICFILYIFMFILFYKNIKEILYGVFSGILVECTFVIIARKNKSSM